MEPNVLTDIILPIALAIIMLGMGLSLVIDDFKRVLLYPKAVSIGLINQLLILPIVGFGLASLFPIKPELAVGLMILAACPGGVTSNLISHVSKGDTALSITLTAISSLLTILTIPFIINIGLEQFMEEGKEIHLDVVKTIKTIVAITILPVSIGMLIRAKASSFAQKMDKPVKITSTIFLVLIIAGIILKEKENILSFFQQVGLISLSLNALTMLIGFYSAKIFKLNLAQSISVSIESGVQNGTLGIFIALSILKNSEMSITPAIYSLVMFGTSGFMMYYFGRRSSSN
ncbi:MAG TPA: bile acid:sodium symporter family protein [Flavobacteriales bacterium]|nr:bile acid:sodium symporter family protein [Flavobacteriales bacterium]